MFLDPSISRRRIFTVAGFTALPLILTACGGGSLLPVTAGSGTSPPATGGSLIDDAGGILAKADSIRQALSADAQALIDKGKALLDSFKTSGAMDTATTLISTIASLATFLPPPYGTIALAIKTLVPVMAGAIGMRTAAMARTGLTVAQAREIIQQR